MKCSLWDLDNCLSNDEWRIRFVDWTKTNGDERYREYHRRCFGDRPGNKQLFQLVTLHTRPVFITARPEEVRASTEAWVREMLGVYAPEIYMRAIGDHRPSGELKLALLEEARLLPIDIAVAFDDRADVVAAYRAFGIDASILAIHATCAMTPPNP